MSRSVYLHNFGCRLNYAETSTLRRALLERGWQSCEDLAAADLVVINTCTVTARADADTRKLLRRIARRNPGADIALVGCQAQLQANELAAWPQVRWVLGNAAKMDLPDIVAAELDAVRVPPIARENFVADPAPPAGEERTRANLKVQEGCDFYCSYCVVPYARGPARSRRFEDCLAGARALLAAGFRELVLTGVNVGSYADEGRELPELLAALLALPGLERLRLSSIEPGPVVDRVIDLMAADERLCRHLHLPLQHGSDRILQLMNRRYRAADWREQVQRALDRVPGIAIGTDVLVGFPTAGEEDFAACRELLDALPMAYFHVFSYSERPAAKSREIGPPVHAATITARARRLRGLGLAKRAAWLRGFLGQTATVLCESRRDDHWEGLTDNYIRVHIDAAGDEDLANRLVPVRLRAISGQTMRGDRLAADAG